MARSAPSIGGGPVAHQLVPGLTMAPGSGAPAAPYHGTSGSSVTGEAAAPIGQPPGRQVVSSDAMVVLVVAALRVVQCAIWPIVVLVAPSTGLRVVGLAVGVYAVQTAWSLTWCVVVVRVRRIPAALMALDVPLAVACLVASGLACAPPEATTWANSAVTPAIGVALAVGVALPWPFAAGSVAGLIAGYVAGLAPAIGLGEVRWSVAAVNVAVLCAASVAASVVTRALRRSALERDALRSALAQARDALAAAGRLEGQRGQQYRMLHDTALSTLSALARGGLDTSDPLVRQRCAADADYLRALIAAGEAGSGGQVPAALAAVARQQAGLGLRAQVRCADLPVDVPDPVVQALAAAVREALNNVLKHSGTSKAWVTALGVPGGPGVTVTDQGCGFDAAAVRTGSGLQRSIGERMARIGGTLRVRSSPGQGTTVELAWPGSAERPVAGPPT